MFITVFAFFILDSVEMFWVILLFLQSLTWFSLERVRILTIIWIRQTDTSYGLVCFSFFFFLIYIKNISHIVFLIIKKTQKSTIGFVAEKAFDFLNYLSFFVYSFQKHWLPLSNILQIPKNTSFSCLKWHKLTYFLYLKQKQNCKNINKISIFRDFSFRFITQWMPFILPQKFILLVSFCYYLLFLNDNKKTWNDGSKRKTISKLSLFILYRLFVKCSRGILHAILILYVRPSVCLSVFTITREGLVVEWWIFAKL